MSSELERIRQLSVAINTSRTNEINSLIERAQLLAREHLPLWIESIGDAMRRWPNSVFVRYYYYYNECYRIWFQGENKMDSPVHFMKLDIPSRTALSNIFFRAYAAELTSLLAPPFKVEHRTHESTDDHGTAYYIYVEWMQV